MVSDLELVLSLAFAESVTEPFPIPEVVSIVIQSGILFTVQLSLAVIVITFDSPPTGTFHVLGEMTIESEAFTVIDFESETTTPLEFVQVAVIVTVPADIPLKEPIEYPSTIVLLEFSDQVQRAVLFDSPTVPFVLVYKVAVKLTIPPTCISSTSDVITSS